MEQLSNSFDDSGQKRKLDEDELPTAETTLNDLSNAGTHSAAKFSRFQNHLAGKNASVTTENSDISSGTSLASSSLEKTPPAYTSNLSTGVIYESNETVTAHSSVLASQHVGTIGAINSIVTNETPSEQTPVAPTAASPVANFSGIANQAELTVTNLLSISEHCLINGRLCILVAHVEKTTDQLFIATVIDPLAPDNHVFLSGQLEKNFYSIKPGYTYEICFCDWIYAERRLHILPSTQSKIRAVSSPINFAAIPAPTSSMLPTMVFPPINTLHLHSDGAILNVRGKLIQVNETEVTTKNGIHIRRIFIQDAAEEISIAVVCLWRNKCNLPLIQLGNILEISNLRKKTYANDVFLESTPSTATKLWKVSDNDYGVNWPTRNSAFKQFEIVGIDMDASSVYPACTNSQCNYSSIRRLEEASNATLSCQKCNRHFVDSDPTIGIVLSAQFNQLDASGNIIKEAPFDCRIFRRGLEILGFHEITSWPLNGDESTGGEIKQTISEKLLGFLGCKLTGTRRGTIMEVKEKL